MWPRFNRLKGHTIFLSSMTFSHQDKIGPSLQIFLEFYPDIILLLFWYYFVLIKDSVQYWGLLPYPSLELVSSKSMNVLEVLRVPHFMI